MHFANKIGIITAGTGQAVHSSTMHSPPFGICLTFTGKAYALAATLCGGDFQPGTRRTPSLTLSGCPCTAVVQWHRYIWNELLLVFPNTWMLISYPASPKCNI
uniref:Uncharacterized protein n=1 Tax=Eutreptiella gymnastica TaxID=73025 RepID=A0A7S1N8K9_9EUGL